MVLVLVELDYGGPMTPDERFVHFMVDARDALTVHQRFVDALQDPDGYLEVVDRSGDSWPFHVGTLRRVLTRSIG